MNQIDEKRQKMDSITKKKKSKFPFILLVVFLSIVAIIVGVIVFAVSRIKVSPNYVEEVKSFVETDIIGQEGEVSTISKALIEEVFEISELQTADYIYNGIAIVYDEDGKTVKYHVAYEGQVSAGVNFSAIDIAVDEEDKKIIIQMPSVTIQDTIVDSGSLEYIFENKKYNNEKTWMEAYDAAQKDLNNRVANEKALLELAKSNAKQVVEAMIKPWVEQIDNEYVVVIE